jgi:hypothetical protein
MLQNGIILFEYNSGKHKDSPLLPVAYMHFPSWVGKHNRVGGKSDVKQS